jgi:hypothetical protein
MGVRASNGEELVKVFVDLPDDDARGAESMWAKQVGQSLYQVRNVPFYAFDLHFNDIVKAVPDGPGRKPRIIRVVKASGHKTLRVIFPADTPESRQVDMLSQLLPSGATYERATARMVAIDVAPDGHYQAVCDQLWAWEQEGFLWYETGTK